MYSQNTVGDNLQELALRSIQKQTYGDLYAFSDEGESMDDIDKRYKSLGAGFKNFSKQRKKLNSSKGPIFDS